MDHIAHIIDSGEFEKFIGMPEDAILEVKALPYDLSNAAAARYELAKDVCALANSSGGFLIIGLSTQKATDRAIDVIQSLALMAEAAFPVSRYIGVIQDHVYPSIQGLHVCWVKHATSSGGLGSILVPQQHPDLGPFLISKVVADGAYLKEIVVGYAERRGAENEPLPPKKLQEALRKGRDTHSQRLSRLESKVDSLLERSPLTKESGGSEDERLNRRIAAMLQDLE